MVKLLVIIIIFLKRMEIRQQLQTKLNLQLNYLEATIFEIEGYGEEKYIKDQLISF